MPVAQVGTLVSQRSHKYFEIEKIRPILDSDLEYSR